MVPHFEARESPRRRALAYGALLACLTMALSVNPVGAAKGGPPRISSTSITVPDTTFGGTVTASVSGTAGLYVRVECRQGGATQYVAVERTDAAGTARFQMGPTPTWQSGAADCTAQAGHFDRRARWLVDATTDFHVEA